MRIKFYWIGATRDSRMNDLEQEYLGRIRRFLPAAIHPVAEQKKQDPRGRAAQMSREGEKLLSLITPGSTIVALDEKGESLTSTGLAEWLEKSIARSQPEIAFIIGGFWGIPDEVRNRADKVISLSRLTFTHEIARVLLLEQIYRALAINNNLTYHK